MQVPTLREVLKLPRSEAAALQPTRPQWSTQQGIGFIAGLLLLGIGFSVLGTFSYQFAQLDTDRPTFDGTNSPRYFADRTPEETLHDWSELRDTPLMDRTMFEPRYLAHRKFARTLLSYMGIGGALGIVGLGLCAWAVLYRPQPVKRPAPRKPAPIQT